MTDQSRTLITDARLRELWEGFQFHSQAAQGDFNEVVLVVIVEATEALELEAADLRERLAAEIANRRDGHRLLVEERGVRDVCSDCDGLGTKSYGSTATWRGGVGGQAFTTDVCNKCWGSGDSARKWPSHAEIQSLRERLAKAREEAVRGPKIAQIIGRTGSMDYALNILTTYITDSGVGVVVEIPKIALKQKGADHE